MQWEYYVKDFKFDENQIEDGFPNKLEHDDLAHLGNAGWELINIVFKKKSYLWNNNNKVDTKNFMESFLVLSILDMQRLKIFNLRFLQDSNLRPTA